MIDAWKLDKTWQAVEAKLMAEHRACLSKLTDPSTSWEETLQYRGRYALVLKLLKLPEGDKSLDVTPNRGQNAR